MSGIGKNLVIPSPTKVKTVPSSVSAVTENPDLMKHIGSFAGVNPLGNMGQVNKLWKTSVSQKLKQERLEYFKKKLIDKIVTFNNKRNVIKNLSLMTPEDTRLSVLHADSVNVGPNQGIMKVCNLLGDNIEFMESDDFVKKYADVHKVTEYFDGDINLLQESKELVELLKEYNRFLQVGGGSKQKKRKISKKSRRKTLKKRPRSRKSLKKRKRSKRSKRR